MKLPNGAQAVVPERKITDYLLSMTHRDGRSKAAFFLRFGFTPDRWEALADTLRRHAVDNDMPSVKTRHLGRVMPSKARCWRRTDGHRRCAWSGSSKRVSIFLAL